MNTINDIVAIINSLYPVASLFDSQRKEKNVRCPFHKDNRASAHLYPDGLHCFTCGKTFRPAQVAEALGMDLNTLWAELIEHFGDEETLRHEYEFNREAQVEIEVEVKPRFRNADISKFVRDFFGSAPA